MKLVPDRANWWRWYSSRGLAVAVAVQGAWIALPDDLKAGTPDWLAQAVTVVVLVGTFLGRLVEQDA